jgi:hypothetical protein
MDLVLSKRDLNALQVMARSPGDFLTLGQFSRGIGRGTLLRLAHLRLAGQGMSHRFPSQSGWKISEQGIRFLRLTK